MKGRLTQAQAVRALNAGLPPGAIIDMAENLPSFQAFYEQFTLSICVTPLEDKQLPEQYWDHISGVRKMALNAMEEPWRGLLFYRMRAGFTLKQHAPKLGPCYQNFDYLQNWKLLHDNPTPDAIITWTPRFLRGSRGKKVAEQRELMGNVRADFGLPDYCLQDFGDASVQSSLILSHYNRTGERTPLNRQVIRTNTFLVDGGRLNLGGFDEAGLRCVRWLWGEHGYGGLGCFPLGVMKALEN